VTNTMGTWRPLVDLRWRNEPATRMIPVSRQVLQQLWVTADGGKEWRDVPLAVEPGMSSTRQTIDSRAEHPLYDQGCTFPPTAIPIAMVKQLLIECATHFAGGNVPMEHKEAYAKERVAWCFRDDHTIETCKAKFNNAMPFAGIPSIPEAALHCQTCQDGRAFGELLKLHERVTCPVCLTTFQRPEKSAGDV
jgi:hypothetical protein